LCNSKYALANEQKLTVAYLGGSITHGAGASNGHTKSYRGLVHIWLQEQFPAANISMIDAGVSGTGSDLGAFRCEHDVIAHAPDLIFVEFGYNDRNETDTTIYQSMEGIVRHIYRSNPFADIVFFYVTTARWLTADTYESGNLPASIVAHRKVADHYAIPSVDAGAALWPKVKAGHPTGWLFMDGVHPNDSGHQEYAKAIEQFLTANLVEAPDSIRTEKAVPEPITSNPLEYGRLIDCWDIAGEGWIKEDTSMAGCYPHRIAGNTAGATLSYNFTATAAGVYYLVDNVSGDFTWSLDSSAAERVTIWDTYAATFKRASYRIFSMNLADAKHNVTLTVLGEKADSSEGTWVRIGALMVNGKADAKARRQPDKYRERRIQFSAESSFSSPACITISIANCGIYAIRLFDLRGRYIAPIHNGYLPKGKHTCNIGKRNFASGLYFSSISSATPPY
jgi:lysophospholipase L1-like esterase